MHTWPGFLRSDGDNAFCVHKVLYCLFIAIISMHIEQYAIFIFKQTEKTSWCARQDKICPMRRNRILKFVFHVLS